VRSDGVTGMTQPRTFTARGPVDLIAAVPYVLGFHPEDSVVLLTFGPGEAFHARIDLPADEEEQLAVVDMLAAVVAQHGVGRVALLLYTEDPWVAATFHDAAVPVFVRGGVEVIDVLRVGPGRFHDACDVDDPGTAYDLKAHAFTAEQVLDGTVVERSRNNVAAGLRVVDPADAEAVEQAACRYDETFAGLEGFLTVEGIHRHLADEARWIQRTLRRHVRDGSRLSVEDAGRLLVLVAGDPLRDVALAEIGRPDARRHVELWRDLVRRSPEGLLAQAAVVLAFAAWLKGDGALAWCALDRCAEVEPDHRLAAVVAGLLEGAVPPSTWTTIPEEDLLVFWPPDRWAS
jgi:hypothetical protein